MALVFQIALGIVLAVLILCFLPVIIGIGYAFLLAGIGIAVLFAGGYFLYETFQATKALSMWQAPLWQAVESGIGFIFTIVFTIVLLFLFMFSPGMVLEARTSLRGREAYILGVPFFPLLLFSVLAGEWLLEKWPTDHQSTLLFAGGILAAWAALLFECWRRIRRRKLKPTEAPAQPER